MHVGAAAVDYDTNNEADRNDTQSNNNGISPNTTDDSVCRRFATASSDDTFI